MRRGHDRDLWQALTRMESLLRDLRGEVVDALMPGIDVHEKPGRDGEPSYPLPADVRTWFAWHNGCDDRERNLPMAGLRFLQYKYALRDTRSIRDIFRQKPVPTEVLADPDLTWKDSFLILAEAGWLKLVVDLDVDPGQHARVCAFALDEGREPDRPENLLDLVTSWNECLERGVYAWDPETDYWQSTWPHDLMPLHKRLCSLT